MFFFLTLLAANAEAGELPYAYTNVHGCSLDAPYAVLHEHSMADRKWQSGGHWVVCEEMSSLHRAGVPNDEVSSVTIANGAKIVLCQHSMYDTLYPGECIAIDQTLPRTSSEGLHDAASSMLWQTTKAPSASKDPEEWYFGYTYGMGVECAHPAEGWRSFQSFCDHNVGPLTSQCGVKGPYPTREKAEQARWAFGCD